MIPFFSPTIHIDRCSDLGSLLTEVSQGSEIMRADATLGDGMILARLEAVTPEEFRERIARLSSATWQRQSNGSWFLTRTAADRARVKATERHTATTLITAALGTLTPSPAGDPEAAARAYIAVLERDLDRERSETSYSGPIEGLLTDLLQALTPERIASLPFMESVIFSDAPNPRESPLPPAALMAIARYKAVDEALARAITTELERQLPVEVREGLVDAARRLGVSRTMLQVERGDRYLRVALATYDNKGATRAYAQQYLPLVPTASPSEGLPETKLVAPGDVEALKALREGNSSRLRPFLDPVAHDPLELRVLPALRARPGNLLIALPDAAVPETAVPEVPTWTTFRNALTRSGTRLHRDGTWLLGEPINPEAFDRACLPRRELRRWIVNGEGRDLRAIRSTADLYASTWPRPVSGLFRWYRDTLLPRVEPKPRESSFSRSLYQTLGTLSNDEWGRLAAGYTVAATAPPTGFTAVEQGSRCGIVPLTPTRPDTPRALLIGTAAFPQGLPPTTVLALDSLLQPVVADPSLGWIPLEGVVAGIVIRDGLRITEATDEALSKLFQERRFQYGQRLNLRIRIQFDNNFSRQEQNETDQVEVQGSGLAYLDLPPSARRDIRNEFARFLSEKRASRVYKP